jgi:O-Antigen ligase
MPTIPWTQAAASSPPFLAAVLLLLWSSDGGGYSPSAWYPGLLFLEALALTIFLGAPWLVRSPEGGVQAGFVALAALAAWAFGSIAWAQVRGDALDGANRSLMYLVVFALFAAWRFTERSLTALLLVLGVGMCVVGLVAVQHAIDATHPADAFIGGRLAEPTGYPNANAALYLAVFWPMLHLAGERSWPLLVRAFAAGNAALLLQLGLLPESRGAVYSLPVVSVVYLAIVRRRWHRLILMALLGAVTYAASGPIFDVYRSGERARALTHSLAHARTTMIAAAALFGAVAALVAFVDRRATIPIGVVARVNRAATAGLVLAVAVSALVYGLQRNAAHDASSAWRSFKSGGEPQGSTRLHGLGSNRYDFWRVSLQSFAAHPLAGSGADNFAASYVRHRRSSEEPLYPHSIEMQLASGLGSVGLLLFAAFLAGWGHAVFVRLMRTGALAGAAAGFVYLFVHGSVDWLWDFPALGGLAFALAGAAAGTRGESESPHAAARAPRGRRAVGAVLAGAGAFALAAAAVPLVSQIQIERASRTWRADPVRAVRLLDDAAAVNFVSDRPYLIAGSIARRVGLQAEADRAFSKAVGRNPFSWYGWLQLSLQDWALGERRRARAAVARALELNPREFVIKRVAAGMRRGRPETPQWVDDVLGRRIERLTAPG